MTPGSRRQQSRPRPVQTRTPWSSELARSLRLHFALAGSLAHAAASYCSATVEFRLTGPLARPRGALGCRLHITTISRRVTAALEDCDKTDKFGRHSRPALCSNAQ